VLEAALCDTSFIVNGLHSTVHHSNRYHAVLDRIRYPVTSSYAKFEYLRLIGGLLRLAHRRLQKEASVGDAITWINSISSARWGRGPYIAVNLLVDVQKTLREPNPAVERAKALSYLEMSARHLARGFGARTRLEVRDGTRCRYQSMAPGLAGPRADKLTLEPVKCTPAAIRCRVAEHLLGNENRKACNLAFSALRRVGERTSQQENMVQAIALGRTSPTSIADSNVCTGIGDLLIALDALPFGHALTIDGRDWRALDGVFGVRIHVFSHNPTDEHPRAFRS